MAPITDFRSCLRAVEEGNFEGIDLPVFIKKLQDGIEKLGDHLQYALHKYCKENQSKGADEIVIKLSRLCFSKESTSGFLNMERFLGSLFHIVSYFLKAAEYEVALEISKSIEIKKTDIEKSALENNLTRSFLYLLHSHFITGAQKITENIKDNKNSRESKLSEELALMSIKFLQLIKSKQLELGRKVFRNFRCYFNSVKYCDKKSFYIVYKNLDSTLANLMPSYKEDDFLLYYIVKICQVEGQNDMNFDDVNNYFRKHLELISIVTNDALIRKYLNLIFSGDSKDLVNGFQKIVSQSKSKLFVLFFSIYFNVITQLWVKTYGDQWGEKFSPKFAHTLYNSVIMSVLQCIRNCSDYCRLMDYQMSVCFSDILLLNCLKMIMMVRLCLKYHQLESLDVISISCECFKIVRETLNGMKNQCCLSQKKTLWNMLVIHYTNTIEGLLKHAELDGIWTYMKNCSEELIFEVINSEFEIPYEWRRVKVLFQRWHYACMKLSHYDEALFICTLYAMSYPQEEEDAMHLWIQTKLAMSDNTTIKDVVDKKLERIKRMNPKCKEDLKALLMMELRVYSSYTASNCHHSPTLSNSMKNVWALLKNMDLQLWERADALNHVIMSTVSSADVEYLMKIKAECEEVVSDILKQQKSRNCRRLVFGGNLKYSLFLCHLRSVQDIEDKTNDSKSILEYLKKEDAEKVKMGEEVDMNLTCNVMPSSNRFTVKFEETYLNALNETFNMWEEAAEIAMPTSLQPNEFNSWLNNIKQISQMYYLIGDVQHSILSWMLYYRIAKVGGNRPSALLALSQIIPHCGTVDDSQVLQEAEEIAEDLLAHDKKKEILFAYWLSLGLNYLKKMNEEKCYQYLCKMKDALSSLKSAPKFTVYNARYWCLVSKFLCLYDKKYFKEFGFRPETQLTTVVYKAYSYANAAIKDGCIDQSGSTEFRDILLTVLEVNVWAAEFYSTYYQAGYVRLFLDDLYQIFQKLVLPTRTAYILVLLAEVDVMCEKREDANMKLMSLKSILGSSSITKLREDYAEEKPALLQVPTNAEEEKESPRALSPARFLDVHDPSKDRDPSPLRFFLNKVDLVQEFRHIPRCSCYSCHSIMIKLLQVNALLIEAQVHELSGENRQSSLCYRECYSKQRKLECYQLELNHKLFGDVSRSQTGFDLELDFQSDVVRSNAIKVLMSYSIFMLSPTLKEDMRDEVRKFIAKIDTVMNDLSFQRKLLQWKIMELKLTFFTIQEPNNKKKEEKVIPQQIELSPPNIVKTPVKKNQAAPVKYKQTKVAKSPINAFVLKPAGRKVFSDDEDSKPKMKTPEVPVKKSAQKQPPRRKREVRKRSCKANVEAMADVELLS
ncbi:UNVERIFIED_CONTAM: hypothetical protein PYX00_007333 [Menopon gallinae]|uniref:Separase n=1 Tax=Menopon gallinae TaxID=328185 RepID=A0AAW2HIR1_9NEOP